MKHLRIFDDMSDYENLMVFLPEVNVSYIIGDDKVIYSSDYEYEDTDYISDDYSIVINVDDMPSDTYSIRYLDSNLGEIEDTDIIARIFV